MKIAVFSDVHGNMDALEKVLEDAQQENCEKFFVLGDYAMAGPEPDAAVRFFMEKHSEDNFYMIQGNTDEMIGNYSQSVYDNVKEHAPVMAEALKDDFGIISVAGREFLKNLPPQLSIEEEGVSMLLVHGSPRKNNEDILPDIPMSSVSEMVKDVKESIILCGHTHIPCGFQTATRKTVINVGSVGRPFTPEPKSCYLTITLADGKALFEHKFVQYNNERAALKLQKRTFLGANKLANTLINPEIRHF